MMNDVVSSQDVIGTLRQFMASNGGDEATESLILAIGAELLGISDDMMSELLSNG